MPPRVVPGYQFPANTTLRLLRVEPKDEISSAFTREEVAALAVMSTDYYTRLEQQRGPQPSEQMLASLARALRLGSEERELLLEPDPQ